jgi:hypothetical protein
MNPARERNQSDRPDGFQQLALPWMTPYVTVASKMVSLPA